MSTLDLQDVINNYVKAGHALIKKGFFACYLDFEVAYKAADAKKIQELQLVYFNESKKLYLEYPEQSFLLISIALRSMFLPTMEKGHRRFLFEMIIPWIKEAIPPFLKQLQESLGHSNNNRNITISYLDKYLPRVKQ